MKSLDSRTEYALGYTRRDLEPLSFDDLPLGGEWTTRRRTVTEAEIALFAGVAGDFSPLTIEAGTNGPRAAPPSLVVAMAVGLGSVDMPVPSVAEWEWLNWKFPRAVHAGDTIYARWILTQKRPPVVGAASSIVVWRVDVHTIDGAVVAEGEIGAKVKRHVGAAGQRAPEQAASAPGASRRRRGRRSRSNGTASQPAETPVVTPPAVAAPKPERTSSSSRRRRRRRSSGSSAAQSTDAAPPPPEPEPAPPAARPAATTGNRQKGIGGVLRRLRGS